MKARITFQRFMVFGLAMLCLYSYQLKADVKLPKVLGSHMVLQRNLELNIWGWADRGEKVTVQFNQQEQATKTDKNGRWQVTLKPMKAGGPYTMTISGKNKITLEDILIGDVWICSGQSNMEWTVNNSDHSEEEIKQADHANIRLFTAPKSTANLPLDDLKEGEWEACTPESIPNFSAVGYFFARHLQQKLEVPIGLIHTSWGGTNLETWASAAALKNIPGFEEPLAKLKSFDPEAVISDQRKKIEALVGPLTDTDQGMDQDQALWASPQYDHGSWLSMELPQTWESAGLEGLDGVVWFMKTFELTPAQAQSDITLNLGPIDDSDITWLNGEKVGTTEQYNQHRAYLIAANQLKTGTNTLVIRVHDTGGGGGIYGQPEDLYVETANRSLSLAGNWKYKVGMATINQGVNPNALPALLYNAMIHPLIPYGITGAIWYQGESNAGRAHQYRTLFPNMIQDWRQQWQQGNFPFLFVQLANFTAPVEIPGESDWAELREAQLLTLGLSNTGMAVTIDVGEADDIHPTNKQDVGRRLALAALKVAYGQELVYSGPTFKEMQMVGSEVHITFDQIGSGLEVKDRYGYLKGFAVAGADRKFYWAQARLENNTVILHCDQVSQPVAVRYGWANNPDDINLYNKEGLPASPFRTDKWPGITQGKIYTTQ